jgi:2-polyprenyl-6-methoxyphenol hydroxylase-like FAD-dependent oxidoreductase
LQVQERGGFVPTNDQGDRRAQSTDTALAATVASDRIGHAEYDVVIVGGRVAGGSLALLLGQRGHRVLLIDRDRFPSDTLSTHYMHPSGVELLRRIGVLEDVEAGGLRRITRSRSYIYDCVLEGPIGPPGAYALAPRRDRFDAILVEHASRRGNVEFHDRTRAERLIEENGRVVGVVARRAGEAPREIRARVVVGADGKNSQVAQWVGAGSYHDVPGLRPGYYGYFHGVTPLGEPTLELFFQDEQIGFIFPMEPGVDCLAIEAQPRDFEEFRRAPATVLVERFKRFHGMATRLAGATLEGGALGARSVENYFRKPYGPGWVLTGDAGYCKDPSTGLGMGDALAQALLLEGALDAVLSGADWESSLAEFQRKRDEAMMPLYQATLAFTQAPETPSQALAWLRSVLSLPSFVRMLAATFPAAVAAPGVLPPPTLKRLEMLAQVFGAAPAAPGEAR